MLMNSGIYRIKNILNNKVYIGSSSNLTTRWKTHIQALRQNRHHSAKLQNSYNKYGENNFVYEIIEHCNIEKLITQEQYYFDTLKPEYNIASNAKASGLGRKHTLETKLKISKGNRGKVLSEETKSKMRKPKVNKDNMIGNHGYQFTDEDRLKMKLAHKGQKAWNKGKKTGPLSEQDKLNKSIAAKKRYAKLKIK